MFQRRTTSPGPEAEPGLDKSILFLYLERATTIESSPHVRPSRNAALSRMSLTSGHRQHDRLPGSASPSAGSRPATALRPGQVTRSTRPESIRRALEGGGLILALAACATLQVRPELTRYTFVLLVISLLTWLVASQFGRDSLIGAPRPWVFLAAPLVAGSVTYTVAFVLDAPRARTGTIVYMLIWGATFLSTRVLRPRGYRARVIVASPGAWLPALETMSQVRLSLAEAPPPDFRYDCVVVDNSRAYSPAWQAWLAQADLVGIRMVGAAAFEEFVTGRVPQGEVGGRWAEDTFRISRGYVPWKRLFDLAIVIVLSPVLLVVMAVLSLIILLDSGGPVLYRQERVGLNGQLFSCLKLRTMTPAPESGTPAYAREHAARITRSGRWMRQYRFDELPQFWNVFRGEMSLIGPRPDQLSFFQHYCASWPLYSLRCHVRPGISGWAQIRQGYTADDEEVREKLRYDLYYIKHCSPLMDLRIALKTVRTILGGFGAE